MNKLQKLENISPTKITYRRYPDFSYGVFRRTEIVDNNTIIVTDNFIEIDKNINKYKKLAVLAHEIGHAICFQNNCKCVTEKSNYIAEFHANYFALNWLKENKCKKSLKWLINLINQQQHDYDVHGEAARKIKRTKLYRDCLEELKCV